MKSLLIIIALGFALLLYSCDGVSFKEKNKITNPIQFKSVKIGNQIWMTENLNVSTFRNGDPIMEAKTNEQWIKAGKTGKPAWCYYDNDSKNGAKYGKLYNWFAVIDKRGLVPTGWHIPSEKEWNKLINFLGKDVCKQMKTTFGWDEFHSLDLCQNCSLWNEDKLEKQSCNFCKDLKVIESKESFSGNGTNKSGFSALPAGFRDFSGEFSGIGTGGLWWTNTQSEYMLVKAIDLSSIYFEQINIFDGDEDLGLSVRCVKD
jgi:uncharacterized protein (TIGR02145 family)